MTVKILKKIFLAIFVLIALVLLIAAFAPKKYAVERKVTINQPVSDVFAYIKMLRNQDNYSVWATMDPDMKKDFRGVDGTVGFVSIWVSEDRDVGKGEQEITGITEGERIDFELHFIEPFEATDYAFMSTTAESTETTEVKWGFNGEMAYPMNMMLLFMDMEKMLGKDLEMGLRNLKVVLENR